MLTFTDKAREKIQELLAQEEQPGLALRLGTRGRGPGGFNYQLAFVTLEERTPEDLVVDAGGFETVVDPQSAPNLEGATVDFVEQDFESGFKIENPNAEWKDPLAKAVQEVLDTRINPGVASHGGAVTLLEVKEGVAYVQMSGGCQGCGMAGVTLKQGVEAMIKEAVPEITDIIDTTDHAAGRNPYYEPAKGGASPF